MKALVVGAAGTIGRACVARLESEGYDVIAADLVAPEATSPVVMDVTDSESVHAVLDAIESDGPLHSLVYAAGVNVTGPLDTTNWQDYERLMAVNLRGAFYLGAAIQTHLRKSPRNFGSVFMSSTAGLMGESGGSVYCASKFGLLGFVESFAAEIAPVGGRANSVCPGNVDSPMLTSLAEKIGTREGRGGASVLADLAAASAFHRLISPEEVAATCSWLVSPQSSGISGQSIVVDGPHP